MKRSQLYNAFRHLSQFSVDSVQSGIKFTDLDEYMHVVRPIENKLKEKMREIDEEGGGIICLVGSAGDGKSHLISRVKKEFEWDDSCYYNDATASCSPKKTAIETLKEALTEYKSENIGKTCKKLLLAINLGKLNAFIDETDVREEYKEICDATDPIFDDIDSTPPIDSKRVKVILFTEEQIFEFYPEKEDDYPIDSMFLSEILEKIVSKNKKNPFYKAYLKDKEDEIYEKSPILLNYELLQIVEVRHTIVMTIIEAIVRFRLVITPREYLDFIYLIMIYQKFDEYKEKKNFYDALLPSLLYNGGDNIIQDAVSRLDPLKKSNTEHDRQLSILFTSYSIPKSFFDEHIQENIPHALLKRINEFYANNGKDIEPTTKFLIRLKNITNYNSNNEIYKSYILILRGLFKKDIHTMKEIYSVVSCAIPHHYGSYLDKTNMIPLNIQGGKYKLFAYLNLKAQPIETKFSADSPNCFYLRFDMSWEVNNESKKVFLRMDYQLYSYLYKLNKGKLALSYENDKNISFCSFVRELTKYCDCNQDISVVRADANELTLSELSFGNIELK